LTLAVPVDEYDVDDTKKIADNLKGEKISVRMYWWNTITYNDDFGRDISWSILRAEGLRANDVASAVANQVDCCYSCLLRVPSHVRRDKTEQSDKWGWWSLCEIVSKQATDVVLKRQTDDQEHAQSRDPESWGRDQETVAVLVAEVAAEDKCDHLDCATRSAVEKRLLCSVTEWGDELWEEVGNTTWLVKLAIAHRSSPI
jgi:hypothetical protein